MAQGSKLCSGHAVEPADTRLLYANFKACDRPLPLIHHWYNTSCGWSLLPCSFPSNSLTNGDLPLLLRPRSDWPTIMGSCKAHLNCLLQVSKRAEAWPRINTACFAITHATRFTSRDPQPRGDCRSKLGRSMCGWRIAPSGHCLTDLGSCPFAHASATSKVDQQQSG